MTAASIDAATLKTIRKARKLGRPRLARLAGMTERQIARLEGACGAPGGISWDAVARIATALPVPPGTLTGDLPVAESDLSPAAEKSFSCCG